MLACVSQNDSKIIKYNTGRELGQSTHLCYVDKGKINHLTATITPAIVKIPPIKTHHPLTFFKIYIYFKIYFREEGER